MSGRERMLARLVSQRFVVTLTDGVTFSGLLREHDARMLHLVDCYQLAANGDQVRVDGGLYLDRARIAYMQRP